MVRARWPCVASLRARHGEHGGRGNGRPRNAARRSARHLQGGRLAGRTGFPVHPRQAERDGRAALGRMVPRQGSLGAWALEAAQAIRRATPTNAAAEWLKPQRLPRSRSASVVRCLSDRFLRYPRCRSETSKQSPETKGFLRSGNETRRAEPAPARAARHADESRGVDPRPRDPADHPQPRGVAHEHEVHALPADPDRCRYPRGGHGDIAR